MDLRKLKTLIELVESSGIAELEIQEGEERVRITRATAAPANGQPLTLHTSHHHAAAPVTAPPAAAAASGRGRPCGARRASGEKPDGRHVLPVRHSRFEAVR